MYDKSVAGEFLVFSIEVTTSLTRIIDLLSNEDLITYNSFTNTNERIEGRSIRKTAIDGFIISSVVLSVSNEADGIEFSFPANERFSIPVINWLEKVFISGAEAGTATILIFLS